MIGGGRVVIVANKDRWSIDSSKVVDGKWTKYFRGDADENDTEGAGSPDE